MEIVRKVIRMCPGGWFSLILFLNFFITIRTKSLEPYPDPIKSRAEQCQEHGYKDSCISEPFYLTGSPKTEHRCDFLVCAKEMAMAYHIDVWRKAPVEGSYCDKGRICENGRCQKPSSGIFPKYTTNETFVQCDISLK